MEPKTHASLVELITINPTIVLDVRYATPDNFTKKIVYPSARVFIQKPVALALDAIQKELQPLGLGLKVFDGYRPLSVQKIFWALVPDARYVMPPSQGSNHNRGAAVDVTIIDLATGKELFMPSSFDDLTERAHRIYTKMDSREAQLNCKFLELIMEKHGFIGFPTEWWHFDWHQSAQYPVLDVSFEELSQK